MFDWAVQSTSKVLLRIRSGKMGWAWINEPNKLRSYLLVTLGAFDLPNPLDMVIARVRSFKLNGKRRVQIELKFNKFKLINQTLDRSFQGLAWFQQSRLDKRTGRTLCGFQEISGIRLANLRTNGNVFGHEALPELRRYSPQRKTVFHRNYKLQNEISLKAFLRKMKKN